MIMVNTGAGEDQIDGPWQVVQRRGRRLLETKKGNQSMIFYVGGVTTGSRFSILMRDVAETSGVFKGNDKNMDMEKEINNIVKLHGTKKAIDDKAILKNINMVDKN